MPRFVSVAELLCKLGYAVQETVLCKLATMPRFVSVARQADKRTRWEWQKTALMPLKFPVRVSSVLKGVRLNKDVHCFVFQVCSPFSCLSTCPWQKTNLKPLVRRLIRKQWGCLGHAPWGWASLYCPHCLQTLLYLCQSFLQLSLRRSGAHRCPHLRPLRGSMSRYGNVPYVSEDIFLLCSKCCPLHLACELFRMDCVTSPHYCTIVYFRLIGWCWSNFAQSCISAIR
jgi:hypothetical protein